MEFRKYNSDELVVVGVVPVEGVVVVDVQVEGVVVEDVQVEGAVVVVGRWTGTTGPSDGGTRTLWSVFYALEAR